jgi:hypothetical protein
VVVCLMEMRFESSQTSIFMLRARSVLPFTELIGRVNSRLWSDEGSDEPTRLGGVACSQDMDDDEVPLAFYVSLSEPCGKQRRLANELIVHFATTST